MYEARIARVRARMAELGFDALVLSVGADLPWCCGYTAVPLERLTMLVLPVDRPATLVVPRLEAPRVGELPAGITLQPWEESEDPVAIVAARLGGSAVVGVGDPTWARFVLALQEALPSTRFRSARPVLAPLRRRKDPEEIERLQAAADSVDAIATAMRDRPFGGRTELDVQRELEERMLAGGHEQTNFAIVASGPNGASPHHDAGARRIEEGDVVVCDFGGTMRGYCSDITRVFVVGEPARAVRDVYAVLADAQETAVLAATVGTPCEAVDAAARRVIAEAGFGEHFVHRTGHGIGVEAHEEPYLVAGNREPLAAGDAFSIEPGIYLTGRFGLRLEDIVVATDDGPRRLNRAPRDLAVVG